MSSLSQPATVSAKPDSSAYGATSRTRFAPRWAHRVVAADFVLLPVFIASLWIYSLSGTASCLPSSCSGTGTTVAWALLVSTLLLAALNLGAALRFGVERALARRLRHDSAGIAVG